MDLRIPTGWLFLLLGLILVVTSFIGSAAAPLTTVNVNLYAGAAMAAFGGGMLWLGRKQRS